MQVSALALVVVAGACSVPPVDYTGKACPCPAGWSCGAASTCMLGVASDGPSPRDAPGHAIDTRIGDAPTSAYRAAVIADQPLAYWRLDDAGTTAVDQLGTYNGTYSGDCTHNVHGAIVDDPDTAVDFEDSCQVMASDALKFVGTSPYSVEAWIAELSSIASGFLVVFSNESRDASGPTDGYAIVDSASGVYFERAASGDAPTTVHTTHVVDKYIHLVGVYDGSAMVLYINGSAGTPYADTDAVPSYSAEALIGADSSGDFFAGDIDEVAVYDHALTAAQVTVHYQLGVDGPRD